MFRVSIILVFMLASLNCGKDVVEPTTNLDLGVQNDANFPSDLNDTSIGDVSPDLEPDATDDVGFSEFSEIIYEQKGLEISNSQSGLFEFEVPPNTKSIVIMMTGKESEFYTIASWKNGDGTDLVPENWARGSAGGPQLCLLCKNRVAASESIGTAYAPNNDTVELHAGTHSASVFAYRQSGFQIGLIPATEVDILVYATKFAEQPFARLALNFHFTGANGLTAENAKDSTEFQAEVDILKDIYDQAKIEIDQINYIDIDSTYQIVENVIEPDSDLQRMFKLGAESDPLGSQNPRGLNVFFVDELILEAGGGFGILLGISGGIPGPIVPGTSRSGVAVAMKDQGISTSPGFILAHEIGHHLGLYHTTEQSQGGFTVHDQITDTAKSDPSLLMYFSGQGRTLSPNQIKVMRVNPWLRY